MWDTIKELTYVFWMPVVFFGTIALIIWANWYSNKHYDIDCINTCKQRGVSAIVEGMPNTMQMCWCVDHHGTAVPTPRIRP